MNSPRKGHWRGALIFSLVCAWINGWVNNREAGDLRCHSAHYVIHSNVLENILKNEFNFHRLTYKDQVTHICVCKLKLSLVQIMACRLFGADIIWISTWNFIRNLTIFSQEDTSENVVCKMTAISIVVSATMCAVVPSAKFCCNCYVSIGWEQNQLFIAFWLNYSGRGQPDVPQSLCSPVPMFPALWY